MPNGPRGAALEAIELRYGGSFNRISRTVTVGVTQVALADADGERVALVFVNNGTDAVFIDVTPQVSTTRGIRMGAAGGLAAFDLWEDVLLPTEPWFGISATAGQTVFVLEVRRETRRR